jgi:hypothetical protein
MAQSIVPNPRADPTPELLGCQYSRGKTTGFLDKISAEVTANLCQNPGVLSNLSYPNPDVLEGFIHPSGVNQTIEPLAIFLKIEMTLC